MTVTAEPSSPQSSGLKEGRVIAIAGPVVDVEFPHDALPEINFALEMDAERAAGAMSMAEIAQGLNQRGVPSPGGGGAWTHTTVERVLARAA